MSVRHISACLADRNQTYSTGNIAVCLECMAIRHGHFPEDARCCKWYYCHCDPGKNFVDPCASAECLACGIVSECGQPDHYHHDGCPVCDLPKPTPVKETLLNYFFEPLAASADDESWCAENDEEYSDDHDIVSEDTI